MSPNNINIKTPQVCLSNSELIRHCCKFCNYQQQYQLSQASPALKTIIIDYIWKSKFREVEIRSYSANDFIVRNLIKDDFNTYNTLPTSSMHFNIIDMDIFLNLNKNNIQKLKIEKRVESHCRFLVKEIFENLRYLELSGICIRNYHFRYIANNCKNLETLNLVKCYNQTKANPLINSDKSLQIIATLENLKSLKLIQYKARNYRLSSVVQIVNQLKLRELLLDGRIFQFTSLETCYIDVDKIKDFRYFQVGKVRPREPSLYFQKHFLGNFENLHSLWINHEKVISDFYNILLKSCGNLKKLTFHRCDIVNFTALPSLLEICFHYCSGLKYRDLKTILNEMNLKWFSTAMTNFEGDYKTFSISPILENVSIIYCREDINIRKLLENAKLLKLTKLTMVIHENGKPNISLKFAPNLQELYINPSYINIKDFLQLKYLRNVVLNLCCSSQLSKLPRLLKHEHLTELSILYCHNDGKSETKINAVKTNLLYFNIPDLLMTWERDFVLDLLNVNTKLSLKCAPCSPRFIRQILLNKKFPKRFKSINICGVLMDYCDAIRDKFLESLKMLTFFKRDCYFTLE